MRIITKHISLAFRHLVNTLLIAAVIITATGCVTENGECPVLPEEDKIGVSLTIAGSLSSGTTRAPGEDSEDTNGEVGTLAESYININDLYIFTFELEKGETVATTDSKLKDILWSPNKKEITTPQSTIYSDGENVTLRTFLDSKKYNTTDNFCIVSVANASEWVNQTSLYTGLKPGETTLGNLQTELNYTNVLPEQSESNQVLSWIPNNETSSGIPLFGIKRVNLDGYNTEIYNSGNPYDLGTVWLLRALAKIEISVDKDANQDPLEGDPVDNIEIESAHIKAGGWNTGLQLIPSPLTRMIGYANTGGTGQVETGPIFNDHEYDPAQSSNTIYFTKVTSADGKESFIAYVPEYDLSNGKGKDIIQIELAGIKQPFNLSVSPYTDGIPSTGTDPYWNCILRNHIYRYAIKGVEIDGSLTLLTLKWTVCPMDQVGITIPPFD